MTRDCHGEDPEEFFADTDDATNPGEKRDSLNIKLRFGLLNFTQEVYK